MLIIENQVYKRNPGKPGQIITYFSGNIVVYSPCSEFHQITHTMLVKISLHQEIFRNMLQQINTQEPSEIFNKVFLIFIHINV